MGLKDKVSEKWSRWKQQFEIYRVCGANKKPVSGAYSATATNCVSLYDHRGIH